MGPMLRDELEALRDLLQARLAESEIRDTAPIARLLADVLVKLDGLPSTEKSRLDELNDRRTRRMSAVPKPTGSGVKRGAGSS